VGVRVWPEAEWERPGAEWEREFPAVRRLAGLRAARRAAAAVVSPQEACPEVRQAAAVVAFLEEAWLEEPQEAEAAFSEEAWPEEPQEAEAAFSEEAWPEEPQEAEAAFSEEAWLEARREPVAAAFQAEVCPPAARLPSFGRYAKTKTPRRSAPRGFVVSDIRRYIALHVPLSHVAFCGTHPSPIAPCGMQQGASICPHVAHLSLMHLR
jgi:hypothetical protein